MDVKKFLKSFRNARRGFVKAFQEEQNFKIQVILGTFVLIFSPLLHIKLWQYILLVLVIFSLVVLELINTVIEKLVDTIHPRLHHYAATIKDLMAAAVLLTAVAATITVILILLPYILWFFYI